MAKKKAKQRRYHVHKKLEQPVHNLVGYSALLALAVVAYVIVQKLTAL